MSYPSPDNFYTLEFHSVKRCRGKGLKAIPVLSTMVESKVVYVDSLNVLFPKSTDSLVFISAKVVLSFTRYLVIAPN